MSRPLPGELRGWGTRRGATVRFAAGAGIAPEFAERLAACFLAPRYSLLHEMGLAPEPDASFVEELANRGYDLSTFRFSVFLASAGRRVSTRPQLLRQIPGVLRARWARVEFDVPDLCTSWHVPARRADSAYFNQLLSTGTYCPAEVDARKAAGQWGRPDLALFDNGVLNRLKNAGFDTRTLRFSVKHGQAGATPGPATADGKDSP